MTKTTDSRAWAQWVRTMTRSRDRNGLDAIADELDCLRKLELKGRADRSAIIDRAAHEAWLKAKAGGSPDEIAAAVKAIDIGRKR